MTEISPQQLEEFYLRAVTGLRSYMANNGFSKVIVGSSGGIDSALTIALAATALGAENVIAITMPSVYSSAGSVQDSATLCRRLGVELRECPIKDIVSEVSSTMSRSLQCEPTGLALENLQARARGVVLMTLSNMEGALVLTTGNKSESSVGYCTLYGDTCGGLNLIGDLYKTEVFALARYLNSREDVDLIPQVIIEKAPSAELAPGQTDQDSLPPYPILDLMLQVHFQEIPLSRVDEVTEQLRAIPDAGSLQAQVQSLVAKSAFKRIQSAPSIRMHGALGLTGQAQQNRWKSN